MGVRIETLEAPSESNQEGLRTDVECCGCCDPLATTMAIFVPEMRKLLRWLGQHRFDIGHRLGHRLLFPELSSGTLRSFFLPTLQNLRPPVL